MTRAPHESASPTVATTPAASTGSNHWQDRDDGADGTGHAVFLHERAGRESPAPQYRAGADEAISGESTWAGLGRAGAPIGPLTELTASASAVIEASQMAQLSLGTKALPDADLARVGAAVVAGGQVGAGIQPTSARCGRRWRRRRRSLTHWPGDTARTAAPRSSCASASAW
jgi:hypothetical protein